MKISTVLGYLNGLLNYVLGKRKAKEEELDLNATPSVFQKISAKGAGDISQISKVKSD